MSLSYHSVQVGRDDSGNSSSSNSPMIQSLEQLSSCDEPALPVACASLSLAETGFWQMDHSLYHCGYELADSADSSHGLLPLHKTVCCSLCRSDTLHCPHSHLASSNGSHRLRLVFVTFGFEHVRRIKLKFHWDQFPRNFFADLLATSPTSS